MIDTEKMKNYLKWRGNLPRIASEIGTEYVYLYRFMTGITNQPRVTLLNELEAWIKKDMREYNRMVKKL